MKKVWLVVMLFLGVLTVSGCQTQLDETDQKVDQSINLFLDEYVSSFISESFVNDSVLASIYHLDPNDNQKHLSGHLNMSMTFDRESAYSLINALVYERVLDKDITISKAKIESRSTENPYEAPTLLHAAYMANVSRTKIDDFIDVILNTDPSLMDADYAGMAMLALSPYKDEDHVNDYIEELKTMMISNLSPEGVISWGNANSATTATVIIGLISIGENPRDDLYTSGDVDLIEALLTYEHEGAFKWMNSEDDIDMMFSTPQAFTALVLYQLYRKNQQPIYLYDFSK